MSIQVQTAYNVAIEYETANSWKRTLAFLIDFFFIFMWGLIASLLLVASPISEILDAIQRLDLAAIVFITLPTLLYHLLFESLNNGQSPGKYFMKIRVIQTDGSYPNFTAYFIRWLFRPLDLVMTAGTLAFIMIGFTKDSQRLGDYVAGTTVINLEIEGAEINISKQELNFDNEYKVTYPNLLSLLSDKDMRIITTIMNDPYSSDSANLAEKLEKVTGYTYNKSNLNAVDSYLNTIVSDYNYLATRKSN